MAGACGVLLDWQGGNQLSPDLALELGATHGDCLHARAERMRWLARKEMLPGRLKLPEHGDAVGEMRWRAEA